MIIKSNNERRQYVGVFSFHNVPLTRLHRWFKKKKEFSTKEIFMGIVAFVLVHLDETDNIRKDPDFGPKMANALSALPPRSRKKIAIGNSAVTVMSANGNDSAFVHIHGNTADRLTSEQESAVEQALARLARFQKKHKARDAAQRIAERE
jgi:hypothetical protein